MLKRSMSGIRKDTCSIGSVGQSVRFAELWDITLDDYYTLEIGLENESHGRKFKLYLGCSIVCGATWSERNPYYIGARFFDMESQDGGDKILSFRTGKGLWHPWKLKRFLQRSIGIMPPGDHGVTSPSIKADGWKIITIIEKRRPDKLKKGTLFFLHDYGTWKMRIGISDDPVSRAESYRRDMEKELHLIGLLDDCPRDMVRLIIEEHTGARRNVIRIKPEDELLDFIRFLQLSRSDWDEKYGNFVHDSYGPYGAWESS